MAVEALFTLPGAPDLNALLDKPLNHEGSLVIPAAQPVEHENEQNIKLVGDSPLLDLHDSIPGVGADLVPADALFGDLVHDFPVGMGDFNLLLDDLQRVMDEEDTRLMTALKMKKLMGYSVQEIAEELDCSQPRVYQLLDRAKELARAYLAEND